MSPASLAELWWRLLLPAAVQATPVLLLTAALDLLLPRALAPFWRSALWLAAALKLVLPFPALAPWGLLPRIQTTLAEPGASLTAIAFLLPVLWLAGALTLAAGSALWMRRAIRRWKSSATLVTHERLSQLAGSMGVAPPQFYESPEVEGPFIAGLLRPALFWPSDASFYLTDAEQDQAMRHELTHLVRRDPWRELAWFLLLAVFWFHPLVWWATRRMRAIREQACDRTTSRLPGHCADSYRAALLKTMAHAEGFVITPGLALIDPRTPLTDRLALLRPQSGSLLRGLAGLAALAAILAAWPVLSWANQKSTAVAEWIVRPPGSLQLQYQVQQRLSEELSK
ncbi:MAG: M56 family metallopeptidase [Bryobacterales bacterium]|nr:M56 family metallopeptidase [Bryobacterales bacterium]